MNFKRVTDHLRTLPSTILFEMLDREVLIEHVRTLSDDETFLALLCGGGSRSEEAPKKRPGRKPKAEKAGFAAAPKISDGTSRPKRERSKDENGERPLAAYAVLSSFKNEDGFKVGDVMKKLDLSRGQASAALTALVSSGKLKKTGKLNGTRYHLTAEANGAE